MENHMETDNEFLIRWNGSPASGSADFGTAQRSVRSVNERPPGPEPKPSEENVKKATSRMIEESREAGKDTGIEWREGDWLFWVYPGNLNPIASWNPPPPPTENIEGKMAAARSWCSPEELAAMDRIADGESPGPLLAEVEGLRKKLAVLEKKEANRELAEMNDILRGGDGNLPQSNEQVIARILGDSASYGQVLRITKLLDRTETFAVDGLKRELEDAKKQIASLRQTNANVAADRARLWTELEKAIKAAP